VREGWEGGREVGWEGGIGGGMAFSRHLTHFLGKQIRLIAGLAEKVR